MSSSNGETTFFDDSDIWTSWPIQDILDDEGNTTCRRNEDCDLSDSYFCDTKNNLCESCSVNICNSYDCESMITCWEGCCSGLCAPEYPCPTGEYCYDKKCLPCPSSCGTWQGSCPSVCPHTQLSIGNIGFFSVALVLVVCSCCFCVVNTARRLYYRRRARQYQELLNQPLIVDDDGEIEGGGPWDCSRCGHHNRLPTRTCDACGRLRQTSISKSNLSTFEVDSDDGDKSKARDTSRHAPRTIWGWEITSEGAIRWLRKLSRGSQSDDEDGEVTSRRRTRSEENVVEEEEVSKRNDDDDDDEGVRIDVDVALPVQKKKRRTKSSNLGLNGWLWEMVTTSPSPPPRLRSRDHGSKDDDDDDDTKDEVDDVELEPRNSSVDSSSTTTVEHATRWHRNRIWEEDNAGPTTRMIWKDISSGEPRAFQSLPPHMKDHLSLSDIAAASKLSLGKKMQWFRIQLAKLRVPWDDGHVKVEVRREAVLSDALTAFENVCLSDSTDSSSSSVDARNVHKIFRFEFLGEPAVDAGGVAREFFELAIDALFRPEFALFERKSMSSYWICSESGMAHPDGEDRRYMRFAGRLLGKALFDGHTTGAYLSRALLKHVLHTPLGISDLRFVDKSLWDMFNFLNHASDQELEECELDFTVTTTRFGKAVAVDLKPGGSECAVTRSNLVEFLRLRARYALMDSIAPQLCAFVQGFYDVVPPQLLMIFDAQELELVLCGLPTIDVSDWRTHTMYRGVFGPSHKVTKWFFEYLTESSGEKKARLLQFVTGTSRVPVSGFRCLQSYDGKVQKFTLQSAVVKLPRAARRERRKTIAASKRLSRKGGRGGGAEQEEVYVSYLLMPKAHTCFNRLDLPVYKTKAELKAHLDMALNSVESVTGFGMD